MEAEEAAPRSLLELPDACLLAVLRCLAAYSKDPASLPGWASAARAHSRLHQAAVAALSSISGWIRQGELDSLLPYLDRHGGHVVNLDLGDDAHWSRCATLHQLPTSLVQLTSLQLEGFDLQLQPGGGFQGVVRCEFPLTQLRLNSCTLLDGEEALAAALSLLPGLDHLSYTTGRVGRPKARFPPQVLPQLPRLTYLELECDLVQSSSQQQPALQPLQSLSRLADLRLDLQNQSISADVLSGLPHLTRLDLVSIAVLEPGALAGKSLLQRLCVSALDVAGGTAGVAQLLSQLQHMQQLTNLDLHHCLVADRRNPPAAAFSALTASSKLQAPRFSDCILPAGVWQHVFPAGRQLPHLTALSLCNVALPGSGAAARAAAPEGSRLVSCCPGLQFLGLEGVQCNATHLAELQGLQALSTLHLVYDTAAEVQAVGLLTQLRELQLGERVSLWEGSKLDGQPMLHLARLRQLTLLKYLEPPRIGWTVIKAQAPGDEPVWRQLLRRHLNHRDQAVAQQAAAALAQCEIE